LGDIAIRVFCSVRGAEIFERFRSDFFRRNRVRVAMGEPADRGAVAEDHDLPVVFRHLIPPPVDFTQEEFHPRAT